MNIENRYTAAREKFFAENPRALTQIVGLFFVLKRGLRMRLS
jgi:hypothetical protein